MNTKVGAMNKKRDWVSIAVVIAVIVIVIIACLLTFIAENAGASDNITLFLPMIGNDVRPSRYQRPYRDTPTPAPTSTVDWHGTPTPTPYIFCFPVACTPVP
jgi:hypothetical protein